MAQKLPNSVSSPAKPTLKVTSKIPRITKKPYARKVPEKSASATISTSKQSDSGKVRNSFILQKKLYVNITATFYTPTTIGTKEAHSASRDCKHTGQPSLTSQANYLNVVNINRFSETKKRGKLIAFQAPNHSFATGSFISKSSACS
jgi:hypothetical protein